MQKYKSNLAHLHLSTSEHWGELLAKSGDSWERKTVITRLRLRQEQGTGKRRLYWKGQRSRGQVWKVRETSSALVFLLPSPSFPACSAAAPGRILERMSPSAPGRPAAALPMPPGLGPALEPWGREGGADEVRREKRAVGWVTQC